VTGDERAIERAIEHANRLRAGERDLDPGEPGIPARIVAIGDPQTSTERFFGVLAAHDLLGADGWMRRDVRVAMMGDYFDYHVPEREHARGEGVLILSWLAAHGKEHVALLLGNHDAARVMELATIDDERFRAAAELATDLVAQPREHRDEAGFRARFPELATPGYAARDYSAFTVEQRTLVQRLLLEGRLSLAVTAAIHGAPALLTHAGVTRRELDFLCLRDHHPQTIADALEDRLAAAVRHVAADWRAGRSTPLSLAPLHVAGADGEEGGGLLYHRPSDPGRPGADASWEQAARAPRRYDPRTALPRGLTQIVGHTGHRKACKEMPRWLAPGTDERPGGLRTLRVGIDKQVRYARGIEPSDGRDAVVHLVDPEMHYVPTPADVAILELPQA
jgi:hypothetical protein